MSKSPQDKGRSYERMVDPDEIVRPLSGAGLLKEDRKSPEYLVQVKHTTSKSYSIKLEDLKTLERNATLESRTPKFLLTFESNNKKEEYVLVPKKVFEWLTT